MEKDLHARDPTDAAGIVLPERLSLVVLEEDAYAGDETECAEQAEPATQDDEPCLSTTFRILRLCDRSTQYCLDMSDFLGRHVVLQSLSHSPQVEPWR